MFFVVLIYLKSFNSLLICFGLTTLAVVGAHWAMRTMAVKRVGTMNSKSKNLSEFKNKKEKLKVCDCRRCHLPEPN